MAKSKKIFIFGVIGFFLGCFLWSIYETYFLDFKTTVYNFRDSDISANWQDKKIVFVSDLHSEFFLPKKRLARLIEKINSQNADIVLFGGDYIEEDSKSLSAVFAELEKVRAKIGKFGVLGNHDWENSQLAKTEMKKAGITPLDNKALWLEIAGEKIKLGGAGDYYADFQYLEPTIQDASTSDFVILLSHNPDFAEKIRTDKIDLMLSGHSHAGQITFFGLWAPMMPLRFPKFRYGQVDTGFTKVITTSGVGVTMIPLRFFSRPEIVVINLR